MNREPDSWKIKGFQSNNEARATRRKIRVSSLDGLSRRRIFPAGLRLNDWTRSRRNQPVSGFEDRGLGAKRRNLPRSWDLAEHNGETG
jgi:hypothetical protein